MQLPIQLKKAIELEAANIGIAQLMKASAELSDNYRFRQATGVRFIDSRAHRIAYAATRMPATYAAVRAVLTEIKRLSQGLEIDSLLDLGAGPGTAAWSASQVFATLRKITLIERDKDLIQLGKFFATHAIEGPLGTAEWVALNLSQAKSFPPHDIVICSYTLGEQSLEQAREIMNAAWQAAIKAVVILEPGTMKGFELIRALRDDLLQAGGHIIAPCPHQKACPMQENDWCHFAARVERSALHRRLKSGVLGYEDEKYSYLAIAKQPLNFASARILRRPQVQSGFIRLQLCTRDGLQSVPITRNDKRNFKQARKANWGDDWSG